LQLIYKRFFSTKSEGDTCTLSSDRALINHRNVTAEPQSAYRADRDFLEIVIKSRIISAAFSVLGFVNKECHPEKCPLPEDISVQSKQRKLEYLLKAAFLIVVSLSITSLIESWQISRCKICKTSSHVALMADIPVDFLGASCHSGMMA